MWVVGGWGGTSERERMEKSIIVKSVSIHMFADLASETEKNCSHSARKQREMLQTTVAVQEGSKGCGISAGNGRCASSGCP